MTPRLLFVTGCLVGFVVLTALPASAHSSLIGSQPAGGATLEDAPDEVVLQFDNPIEESFGGVQVFAPDGERVEAGQPVIDATEVRAPLRPLPQPGTYTVLFRIISGDGHPVESDFTFTYAPTAATPTPSGEPPVPTGPPVGARQEPSPPSRTTATPRVEATEIPSPSPSVSPTGGGASSPDDFELEDAGAGTAAGLWIARLLNQLSLTMVMGLLLTVILAGSGARLLGGPQRRMLGGGGLAAVVWALTALALFTFGVSTAAARPLPDALTVDLLGRFSGTRFGSATLAQAVAALVVAAGAFLAGTRRGAAATLATAAGAALAPVWWGHAGSVDAWLIAVASGWAHVVGVSLWVGGLAVLAVFVLSDRGDVADVAGSARGFSRVAGWAIGAVLVSGIVNALLHTGATGELVDTTWGRLVLAKAALFAGIAWLGWQNRRRFVPRLSGSADRSGIRGAFRRFAVAELALMVAAFGVAATLATVVPAEAEAAGRIQSIVAGLGDGSINLTVDPAEAGVNVVHVYFLGDDGRPRPVDDPTLTFEGIDGSFRADLLPAGPGHYTVLAQPIPQAGDYTVEVTATVDGQAVRTTGSVTVR